MFITLAIRVMHEPRYHPPLTPDAVNATEEEKKKREETARAFVETFTDLRQRYGQIGVGIDRWQ